MNTATDIVLAAARNTLPSPELADDRADYSPVYLCDAYASCTHLLSWAEFSAAAIELWYARAVDLTRADLVTSFDTDKVEASEISLETETFHFITAT